MKLNNEHLIHNLNIFKPNIGKFYQNNYGMLFLEESQMDEQNIS